MNMDLSRYAHYGERVPQVNVTGHPQQCHSAGLTVNPPQQPQSMTFHDPRQGWHHMHSAAPFDDGTGKADCVSNPFPMWMHWYHGRSAVSGWENRMASGLYESVVSGSEWQRTESAQRKEAITQRLLAFPVDGSFLQENHSAPCTKDTTVGYSTECSPQYDIGESDTNGDDHDQNSPMFAQRPNPGEEYGGFAAHPLAVLVARESVWQPYWYLPIVPASMRWGYNICALHTCITPFFNSARGCPFGFGSRSVREPFGKDKRKNGLTGVAGFIQGHNSPGAEFSKAGLGYGLFDRTCASPQCEDTDDDDDIVCHHFELSALWDALDEASTYGIEAPCMDSDGVCSQVAYIPYLSAICLIQRTGVEEDIVITEQPHEATDGKSLDIPAFRNDVNRPSLISTSSSGDSAPTQIKFGRGTDAALECSVSETSSLAPPRSQTCGDEGNLFSNKDSDPNRLLFFDAKPPYARRPLTQMIRLLREAEDPDVPFFSPAQLALLDANTKILDEDSWMAIYWHPVQTEMRKTSGSDVAQTFLICYSLAGAAVQKRHINANANSTEDGSRSPSMGDTGSIAENLPSVWKGPGSKFRRKVEKLSRLYSEVCPMMIRITDEPRLLTFATIPCFAESSLWSLNSVHDGKSAAKMFKENNRILCDWLRQHKMHLPDLDWITRRQKSARRWRSTKFSPGRDVTLSNNTGDANVRKLWL